MSTEHKDITDPNIHEPKGIATAAANRIYVANGTGGGSWIKITSQALQGLTGDAGSIDKIPVSDGAGGFKFWDSPQHGAMVITNNGTNFPLTAVADTTFNTPAQFTLFTGAGAPFTSEHLNGITFSTDKLTVSKAGLYRIETYLNIGGFPSGTAKVALRYRINGSTYSTRKPTIKSSGAGAEGQLVGFGLLHLNANDYVQLVVASDTTGNLLVRDVNSIITMVHQD
jgi:hypothetical protein